MYVSRCEAMKKKIQKINKNELLLVKLNALVCITNAERIKLALQEYKIENKALRSKLETMKKEIETKSLPVFSLPPFFTLPYILIFTLQQ